DAGDELLGLADQGESAPFRDSAAEGARCRERAEAEAHHLEHVAPGLALALGDGRRARRRRARLADPFPERLAAGELLVPARRGSRSGKLVETLPSARVFAHRRLGTRRPSSGISNSPGRRWRGASRAREGGPLCAARAARRLRNGGSRGTSPW